MNDAVTATPRRYALSFTSGALLLREASIAAPLYLRERNWSTVRALIDSGNLLQARTRASGVRRGREAIQRLAVLTEDELELVLDGVASERAHLLWVAACRRYEFIAEFAEEVVRERFVLLTATLGYEDFDAFVRAKAIWHRELSTLTASTLRKLRTNVFRMLIEADLLSGDSQILEQVLSTRVTDALSSRTPSDLRFFPTHVAARRGAVQ